MSIMMGCGPEKARCLRDWKSEGFIKTTVMIPSCLTGVHLLGNDRTLRLKMQKAGPEPCFLMIDLMLSLSKRHSRSIAYPVSLPVCEAA